MAILVIVEGVGERAVWRSFSGGSLLLLGLRWEGVGVFVLISAYVLYFMLRESIDTLVKFSEIGFGRQNLAGVVLSTRWRDDLIPIDLC